MGFLSSLFGVGSRTPSQQTVVQSQKLPPELAPFVKEILGEARDLYRSDIERGYDPYTGQMIAPLTGDEQKAMEGISGLVGTTKPFIEEALATYRTGAEKFTPETAQEYMSPYQRAVTDIEKREAQTNFERNIMPRFEAEAVKAGGLSGLGSRAGVEAAELQRGQSQLLADIEAKGLQSAFQNAQAQFAQQKARERQMAGDIGRTGPALFQAGLAERGAQQTVGEQKRQLAQSALDEAYGKFLEERAFPQQTLADYSGMVYGNPYARGSSFTQTTSGLPGAPSTGQQLLGLGLAGLNIYGAGTAGGNPFSAGRAIGNITGFKKEGGRLAGLSGLPVIKRQGGSYGQYFPKGYDPNREMMSQVQTTLSQKAPPPPPETVPVPSETVSVQEEEVEVDPGLGVSPEETIESIMKVDSTPKKNRFKKIESMLDKFNKKYGVKPVDIDAERKAQEDVSISISEEQDRFEAEEANIAKTLLEQNKKAAAEGNDAQIFRNNMRAIKSAMESPTLATSVIDALAGAGEGAAELEKEIKETNKELDVQFQEQAKESRSRKSKNLLDKISRDEGIRQRLANLPEKERDKFIKGMVSLGTLEKVFAELDAAEATAKKDATEMYFKLAELGVKQARAIAGDAGLEASTLPELFRAVMAKAGFSKKVTEEIIRAAQDPDQPSSSILSKKDALKQIPNVQ